MNDPNKTKAQLLKELSALHGLEQILKKNTTELKESEERYCKLVEALPLAIMAIQNGRFIFANTAGARMLGFSDPEEVVGLPALEVVAPESQQIIIERMKRIEKGKDNPTAKIKLIRRDGYKVITESQSVSIRLQGKSAGVIIFKDVTQIKQAEDRFQLLVEQAGDAFFVLSYDGVIFDVNRQACWSLGYSREELLGMKISEVDVDVEEKQHKLRFWNSLEPGHHITFEGLHRRKDGSAFPVEVRLGRLDLKEKRFLLALVRDVTERKQKEEKLKKHSEFQKLVSSISNNFVGLSGSELEQAIQDTLSEIGAYFDVDTVRIYRLSTRGDVLMIRNMWRSERLAPTKEMQKIHKMKFPSLASHYSRGETIVFGSIGECPQLPDLLKALNFFGTKAGVGVPLEVDELGVDVFAMDKVMSEHVWPRDIVEHSRTIGQVLLSAMHRREAEAQLQDSYDEIKRLKERLEQDNLYLREEIELNYRYDEIVGESDAIKQVLVQAEKVAKQDTGVLLFGETGTGKELIARAIHSLSPRKARTMIKVNCAALPATLIESELFGREKGAFTGALTKQVGRFEVANGSTIFLDEIGDLPLELQTKLLRVLQEGEFERLGSHETVSVDIRIIAATNRDLGKAIKEGRFRRDLYFRLNVFPITVPPLRGRQEDIPLLTWAFIKKYEKSMGKKISKVKNKTMDLLTHYSWPGNVRELKNVIERAMILNDGEGLQIDRIESSEALDSAILMLEEVDRHHIISVLESTRWQISGQKGAAQILGLKPTTLRSKMEKLDIRRPY